ncbi:MAG: DNA-3-methyladenine glycosylase 2 family protein [Frankiales bacterium]|nr:DNA-3-methyladenine glycosylase 2 family protein [Frankiales bacterium]
MAIDPDIAYRAVQSKDARFDGVFFVAVRTTKIYCRPSCAARTPFRVNVEFHPSAASAQRAGFRACKRCRPDSTPGSADWNSRSDLAGRAVRLIADGVVDSAGVPGLARRLGYSERQLNRALISEMGAPPLALARAQRAQTARTLLERTAMPVGDVAFAAGFSSIRQFNETILQVYASTPSTLRAARRTGASEPGLIELRLPYREPMSLNRTLDYLRARAVTGVEHYDASSYSRTIALPHGPGRVRLSEGPGHVRANLQLTDHRDLAACVARIRRLLDLDADPQAVDQVLAAQPPLAGLVRRRPGLRSPGAVDSFEIGVRAIVGQQVSLAAARTGLGRLTAEHGTPAFEQSDADEPGCLFPDAQTIAECDPATLPMPRARGRCLVGFAQAVASERLVLDAGSDWAEARAALLGLSGIGPWTAGYILMRALGHPDVFLSSDLGVSKALSRLAPGLDPAALAPWRSYLSHHLWASLDAEPAAAAD